MRVKNLHFEQTDYKQTDVTLQRQMNNEQSLLTNDRLMINNDK